MSVGAERAYPGERAELLFFCSRPEHFSLSCVNVAWGDIDRKHSYEILREIGETLRGSLREEPDLPANLRRQVDRLRELESSRPALDTPLSNPKE
jgi:hypothetical protein